MITSLIGDGAISLALMFPAVNTCLLVWLVLQALNDRDKRYEQLEQINAALEKHIDELMKVDEKVAQVDEKVLTLNSMTIGQLADATETRRIDNIEEGDRTEGEQEHMESMKKEEDHGNV